MGNFLSYFWGIDTGRTDDPNPVTGLTSRDVYIVKSTWGKIRKNTTEYGMQIFTCLFKKYPQYQQLFPFKNVRLEELKSNKRFQAHCNSLMYALSSIVDNIDDPELLKELLVKQGIAHVPRGVEEQAYWRLKDVLIFEVFQPIMSQDDLKCWEKTTDVAFSIIIDAARSVVLK